MAVYAQGLTQSNVAEFISFRVLNPELPAWLRYVVSMWVADLEFDPDLLPAETSFKLRQTVFGLKDFIDQASELQFRPVCQNAWAVGYGGASPQDPFQTLFVAEIHHCPLASTCLDPSEWFCSSGDYADLPLV